MLISMHICIWPWTFNHCRTPNFHYDISYSAIELILHIITSIKKKKCKNTANCLLWQSYHDIDTLLSYDTVQATQSLLCSWFAVEKFSETEKNRTYRELDHWNHCCQRSIISQSSTGYCECPPLVHQTPSQRTGSGWPRTVGSLQRRIF